MFLFPIYLDYSSTTPVDPRVLEKILPYYYYKFGNYNSRNHIFGWTSEYIVELSRFKISDFLKCSSKEIIFTSGATESNNLAIKGLVFFYKNKKNHIITLKTEHKSIVSIFEYLFSLGYDVTYIDVKTNGLLNLVFFNFYLKKNTILISIMFVNNEIGVIQNIVFISKICKKKKINFHVDGSQALGKLEINLNNLNIDLLTLSSHKNYGPKGVGLLYIRRKSNLYLSRMIHGGGQEMDLRSGTLPVSQIIGFSESFLIIKNSFLFENLKIKNFKNIFLIYLLKIDSIYINGDLKYRIPHNLNISFNFIEGESFIISIKNIAVSTGSACASISLKPSYILNSLKKKYSIIHSSIRFTFGRFNKLNDFFYILKILIFNINKLRFLSVLF